MTERSNDEPTLYALLIGVDYYAANTHGYASLNGAVRDISRVEAFLRTRLAVPEERILKLTVSNTNLLGDPPEPEVEWPTYANMVAKFKELAGMAQPGDQVYIHYSGHGGRASTIFPELKGVDAHDEGLVPTDIGDPASQYLRDVELAHILKGLVDQGLIVTVVLDSCHSGGATRGPTPARVRGVGTVDQTPRGGQSLVAAHEDLVGTWRAATRGGTRNVKVGSGWLPDPEGYVLLAACRPSESAYEYPFDGVQSEGALTHWLLDTFQQVGLGLSYKMVQDRITAKIHTQFELQTPLLEGAGDRAVFGRTAVVQQYAPIVTEVDTASVEPQWVVVSAGQSAGVRQGAQFAIYPLGTNDFTQTDRRLALAELTELGASSSRAKITQRLRPGTLKQGAPAVLTYPGSVRLVRKVQLFSQDVIQDEQGSEIPHPLPEQVQKEALDRVRRSLAGAGWVVEATGDNELHYQVAVDKDGTYEIWDRTGAPIRNLRPALMIDDAGAPAKVVGRLVHLAKYHAIQQLANHDPASPLANQLTVELMGKQADYQPGDPIEPEPFTEPGATATVKPGEWFFVRIRNTSPGPLNVAMLDLAPDWSITQIFPAAPAPLREIDAGKQEVVRLHASLPDGYREGTDLIKVFATLGPADFRFLELPPLDTPVTTRSATRGAPQSQLDQLLAGFAAEQPRTRNVDAHAFASEQWTSDELEVYIVQSGA